MIVVIPTNRQVNLSYLRPLIDSGARFLVVDDSEGSVTIDHPAFEIFTWADRRRILGDLDQHFPRGNGACRDFGFYMAWREAAAGEAIVALDDDCRVADDDFAPQVEAALSAAERPVVSSEGDHLNILELYADHDPALFPRGFPYSARLDYGGLLPAGTSQRAVAFSLGMWRGIYDINAVDKVRGRTYRFPDAELRHPSVVIAEGKLVSVCSMNMQFRRELIPAVYQLPMHIELFKESVVDRYGDIWGGFILKTLMDIKGEAMVVGGPMIDHLKEGDYVRNIWQENLSHQINDEFLRVLSEPRAEIVNASYLGMMEQLTEVFAARASGCSPLLRAYFAVLVPALRAWTKALG